MKSKLFSNPTNLYHSVRHKNLKLKKPSENQDADRSKKIIYRPKTKISCINLYLDQLTEFSFELLWFYST